MTADALAPCVTKSSPTTRNKRIFLPLERIPTGPLCGIHWSTANSPSQRLVTWSFDVFFDLRLIKRSNKQMRRRWFETSPRSLWRHCSVNYGIIKYTALSCKMFSARHVLIVYHLAPVYVGKVDHHCLSPIHNPAKMIYHQYEHQEWCQIKFDEISNIL